MVVAKHGIELAHALSLCLLGGMCRPAVQCWLAGSSARVAVSVETQAGLLHQQLPCQLEWLRVRSDRVVVLRMLCERLGVMVGFDQVRPALNQCGDAASTRRSALLSPLCTVSRTGTTLWAVLQALCVE